LKEDFGVELPRKVFDKMMALITAMSTDRVYRDIAFFDETVNALNGTGVGVDRGIPTVTEVAWAVTELAMNDPEPVGRDKENPYTKHIGKYARVVLDDEGMDRAPKALYFAPSRPVKKEGHDDAQYYAGAWGSAQARADEVDQWIEKTAIELLQQLMSLGIDLQPKEAAWTSDANRDTHLEKHGPEFEDYLAAEEEYSQKEPAESEQFCETDAQGNTRCKRKLRYGDDGVVRVETEDGRTITLYKDMVRDDLFDLSKSRA